MTIGSFSNLSTTFAVTSVSDHSSIRNGVTMTWSGVDSVTVWKPKPVDFLGNVARFYVKERYPQNRVDLVKVASIAHKADANIFDSAREKRFRYPKDPPVPGQPELGDYGVPHPYTKVWQKYRESVFLYAHPGGPGSGTVSNAGVEPYSSPVIWGDEEEYKLLSRLRTKIMGTDFNLASFLGAEGRDTVRFIGETARRINQAQQAMRRADVNAAFQILRTWGREVKGKRTSAQLKHQQDVYQDLIDAVTNRRVEDRIHLGRAKRSPSRPWDVVTARQWLEYHLAIEPLLSDVREGAEQLAHVLDVKKRLTLRTSVTKRRNLSGITSARWGLHYAERRVGIVAYFTQEPDPMNFLGFQNPEVTIWNAIPLTFVVDYVYPIGKWMEAWATYRALPTALYVRSDKSLFRAQNCRGDSIISIYWDGETQMQSSGTFARTISSSMDVPRPEVKPFGVFKSWERAATYLSLILVSGADMVRYS